MYIHLDNLIELFFRSIGCVIYEMFKLEPLFLNKDLKNIINGGEIPKPNLECRKKLKNLFYT